MAGGSYIGLDIGSNLIKVSEVRRGSKGIEVVALDVAPTPQEAFENSIITDPQMLGQAVKALLKKAGIGGGQVVSSVSGQSAVVVRVIDVPQMNAAELAETMKWEVERQVPFNASEVVMDYQPIQRPEGYADGANMEVCLAVAQQDMIDRHVDMLFAAGLKPKAIDVEPLASARCLLELNSPNNTPGHTVAIINVGAANTDVSIFRDKLIAFPRTLSLAGDNLTRAISTDMHVDLATAEQMKRDVGEVIMGQAAPQDNFGNFGGGGFGASEFGAPSGFMDFTDPAAPAAVPYVDPAAPLPSTGPTSSPSGRMPFDFSTPEAAPIAPPTATPFDFSSGAAEAPATPDHGGLAPVQNPPDGTDYFNPGTPDFGSGGATAYGVPAANPNLPVTTPAGDPNREALRINVFNAMAPVLAEMVQEIRRSMDYYRTKTGDAPIHEILLVGGTSKLRNLDAFLQEQLGIPTRVASPIETLPVIAKNQSADYLKDIAALFPVSIGLGAYPLVTPSAAAVKKSKPAKTKASKKAPQAAA
jgi:type IV pilus assembly protein PilM